jgi:hypothetical protein
MKPKIDPLKLTPDQRDKLEAYEQTEKQVRALQDIASMMQELIDVTDDGTQNTAKLESLGAIFVDVREQLIKLNQKEAPEAPDYAKPIVEAISKLEKEFTKAKEVNVRVDAPDVHVEQPPINVDLKGVETILKEDVPKAFAQAISSIPQMEFPEIPDKWDDVIKLLKSIDVASRLKPQFPVSQLNEINNSISSLVTSSPLAPGVDYDYLDVQQTDTDTETYEFKTGGSGGTTVRTIVVNYTDGTKEDIDNITWS